MIKNNNDIGFIHDIGSLDRLRQQAVNGEEGSEKEALTAAAKQFESIFTSMLFKSMRDANSSFKSDMLNSQNEQFYRQMQDDQMASELSASGSLGLADMIVAQLSAGQAMRLKRRFAVKALMLHCKGRNTQAVRKSVRQTFNLRKQQNSQYPLILQNRL
ncbi:rod-binding protein [Vibrio splendidus]|uniref:rod-binding protein n=1 Tax=Vibrio splendidus TaxID=29497 RepID=UPI000A8E7EB0